MRIASIVGLLVLGAASSACTLSTVTNPDGSISITGKSKTRFVSADKPVREQAYTGQAIEVINDGVNPGSGAGIVINGSPGATKVVATASIVSWADGSEAENAKSAQRDVIASFTIADVGGKIVVRCGHAKQDYGTATLGSSGCEGLTVTVPAGDAAKPVSVLARNGNSDIQVSGITGNLTAEAQGAGDVEASITPTKGSLISIAAEFDATLRLPANFAADKITLQAADPKDVDATAFPGVKSGEGFGAAGEGAASISVRSVGLIGKVKLAKQ